MTDKFYKVVETTIDQFLNNYEVVSEEKKTLIEAYKEYGIWASINQLRPLSPTFFMLYVSQNKFSLLEDDQGVVYFNGMAEKRNDREDPAIQSVSNFLHQCCRPKEGGKILFRKLYEAYSSWDDENPEGNFLKRKKFATTLKKLGDIKLEKYQGTTMVLNLKLRHDPSEIN